MQLAGPVRPPNDHDHDMTKHLRPQPAVACVCVCVTTKSRLHSALDRSYKLDCQCKRMFHAKVTTAPRRVSENDTQREREG